MAIYCGIQPCWLCWLPITTAAAVSSADPQTITVIRLFILLFTAPLGIISSNHTAPSCHVKSISSNCQTYTVKLIQKSPTLLSSNNCTNDTLQAFNLFLHNTGRRDHQSYVTSWHSRGKFHVHMPYIVSRRKHRVT